MPQRLSRKELEYMMDFEGSEYINGYRRGFQDGLKEASKSEPTRRKLRATFGLGEFSKPKPKRKLSAWNKFVKANSKKSEFRYRDGKLNLKKMGVAFRRKKRR